MSARAKGLSPALNGFRLELAFVCERILFYDCIIEDQFEIHTRTHTSSYYSISIQCHVGVNKGKSQCHEQNLG